MNSTEETYPIPLESERGYDRIIAVQNYLWVVVAAFVVLLVFSMVAVTALVLTKRTEHILVTVNETSGEVAIVETDLATMSWDLITLMDNFFINNYVIARERYTPEQIQFDWETWTRYSCDSGVLATANANIDTDSDQSYFSRYGNATVIPSIRSINFLQGGEDLVEATPLAGGLRYYTVLFSRTISRSASNQAAIDYQLSIGVTFQERATNAAEKRLNPLGFCVHAYNVTALSPTGTDQ